MMRSGRGCCAPAWPLETVSAMAASTEAASADWSLFIRRFPPCVCRCSSPYLGQRERDVRASDRIGGRGMTRNRVCMCGRARCRAVHEELASVDFVHRRNTFERGVDLRFPKDLSRVDIERADFAIARAGENQSTRRDDRPDLRKVGAGIPKAVLCKLR